MMQKLFDALFMCLTAGMFLTACNTASILPSPTTNDPIVTPEPAPVSFVIERAGTQCKKPGDSMLIKLIFRNLTDKPVRILNFFWIDSNEGNLFPSESELDGTEVIGTEKYSRGDS